MALLATTSGALVGGPATPAYAQVPPKHRCGASDLATWIYLQRMTSEWVGLNWRQMRIDMSLNAAWRSLHGVRRATG